MNSPGLIIPGNIMSQETSSQVCSHTDSADQWKGYTPLRRGGSRRKVYLTAATKGSKSTITDNNNNSELQLHSIAKR